MKTYRYKNLFIYSSLQFCGNIEEYFSKNTEHLVAFVVLPRLKSKENLIHEYKRGRLVKETYVRSSENIIFYYLLWYIKYLKIICTYFARNEELIVLSGHPISFFASSLQKMIRKTTYVFWIGDHFPPSTFGIAIYEGLKKYYHDRLKTTYYLSDGINKVFNKSILTSYSRRTVMWGVKPKRRSVDKKLAKFSILFVGLIKESQGVEFLLNFLKYNPTYFLNIIGICDNTLYKKYQSRVNELKISKQVYFPNKFFSDYDLTQLAKKCSVGVALYNIDKSNPTYYTDPGKVKSYAEMGLPIIMTKVSGIAKYIEKFNAGVLINREFEELEKAIIEIRRNYTKYLIGLNNFNMFFYYENYYREAFRALER